MRRFVNRHPDEVAKVDTTGGSVDVIKLDSNHVRMVLLRLSKGGVTVEMSLPEQEAVRLHDDVVEALRWVQWGDE